MKTYLLVTCCLFSAASYFLEAQMITVEGSEGSSVSFTCSHKNARSNSKYMCRDPCTDDHDVMVMVPANGTATEGRISLWDWGSGTFTVTFDLLQKADSGRYWCGVVRSGYDTYREVQLHVLDAPETTVPVTTTTSLPSAPHTSVTSTSPTLSTSVSVLSNSVSPGIEPLPASTLSAVTVVVMAAIVGLALFGRFYCKCRKNTGPVILPSLDFGSSPATEDACVYENFTKEDRQKNSNSTGPIHTLRNLANSRNHAGPMYANTSRSKYSDQRQYCGARFNKNTVDVHHPPDNHPPDNHLPDNHLPGNFHKDDGHSLYGNVAFSPKC